MTYTDFRLLIAFVLAAIAALQCAKPQQPPLSAAEHALFRSLEKACHCPVERELDPHATLDSNEYGEGWYFISLDSLPCDVLSKDDSLERDSRRILYKLHKNILNHEFNFKYKDATIAYGCAFDKDHYSRKYFTYPKKDLDSLSADFLQTSIRPQR